MECTGYEMKIDLFEKTLSSNRSESKSLWKTDKKNNYSENFLCDWN